MVRNQNKKKSYLSLPSVMHAKYPDTKKTAEALWCPRTAVEWNLLKLLSVSPPLHCLHFTNKKFSIWDHKCTNSLQERSSVAGPACKSCTANAKGTPDVQRSAAHLLVDKLMCSCGVLLSFSASILCICRGSYSSGSGGILNTLTCR